MHSTGCTKLDWFVVWRAGAVEQLRTHTRRLNCLHPPEENGNREMVQLYEKGYGKVREDNYHPLVFIPGICTQ